MTASTYLFERNVRPAPLGVRFWDGVVGTFVRDGLHVAAYPADNPSRRATGYLAGSSTFAFRDLPGLRGFELAVGSDDPWASPLPLRPFVVDVTDGSGRFLPSRFTVGVPHAGIFSPDCLLADMAVGAVPLFSAAGREPPGVKVKVRAELWDLLAEAPAAWALVEARVGGTLIGRGVSDEKGKVVVMGPYPAPPASPFDSPPSAPRPLTSQTWTVTLAAWYTPARPDPAVPDLCAVLGQGPATLWADPARAAAFPGATLTFGRDLVARSTDPSTGKILHVLLISPSGSPL